MRVVGKMREYHPQRAMLIVGMMLDCARAVEQVENVASNLRCRKLFIANVALFLNLFYFLIRARRQTTG